MVQFDRSIYLVGAFVDKFSFDLRNGQWARSTAPQTTHIHTRACALTSNEVKMIIVSYVAIKYTDIVLYNDD